MDNKNPASTNPTNQDLPKPEPLPATGLQLNIEMLQRCPNPPNVAQPRQVLLAGTQAALNAFEDALRSQQLRNDFGLDQFQRVDPAQTKQPVFLQQVGDAAGRQGGRKAAVMDQRELTALVQGTQAAETIVYRAYHYTALKPAVQEFGDLIERTSSDRDLADSLKQQANDVMPALLASRINAWVEEVQAKHIPLGDTLKSLTACTNPLLDHAEGPPAFKGLPNDSPGDGHGSPVGVLPPTAAGSYPDLVVANAGLILRLGLDIRQIEPYPGFGDDVTVVVMDTAPTHDDGTIDWQGIDPELVDFVLNVQTVTLDPVKPVAPKPLPVCYALEGSQPAPDGSGGMGLDPHLVEENRKFGLKYHGIFSASLIKILMPRAHVLLVRVLDQNNTGDTKDFIDAIWYVMALRAQRKLLGGKRVVNDKVVFNLSLGLPRTLAEEVESCCLQSAIEAAAAQGAIFVAAAGNDSWQNHPRNPEEPSAYGYYIDGGYSNLMVLSVSATDQSPTHLAYFSNQGNLGAPGRMITMGTGTLGQPAYPPPNPALPLSAPVLVQWSGTSFATPLVTAAAARLLASNTPALYVKSELWNIAALPARWDDIPEVRLTPGRD